MTEVTSVPAATRARAPGWRDPRILLGVAIMALSVLVGAWLGRSSDDTVAVLVATRDLPAGANPVDADVAVRHVHLDAGLVARYLTDPDSVGVLDRPVRAGELVPRSALVDPDRVARVEVPLSVATDDVPATVRRGSVVDVWVLPDAEHRAATGPSARARLVLDGVAVLSLGDAGGGLAPQATRQVIVAVPVADADQLATALGRTTTGRLVLVRRS